MEDDFEKMKRAKTGDEYPAGSLGDALKNTTEGVDVVTRGDDPWDHEEPDRGGW